MGGAAGARCQRPAEGRGLLDTASPQGWHPQRLKTAPPGVVVCCMQNTAIGSEGKDVDLLRTAAAHRRWACKAHRNSSVARDGGG
jgi:hypothetical protein